MAGRKPNKKQDEWKIDAATWQFTQEKYDPPVLKLDFNHVAREYFIGAVRHLGNKRFRVSAESHDNIDLNERYQAGQQVITITGEDNIRHMASILKRRLVDGEGNPIQNKNAESCLSQIPERFGGTGVKLPGDRWRPDKPGELFHVPEGPAKPLDDLSGFPEGTKFNSPDAEKKALASLARRKALRGVAETEGAVTYSTPPFAAEKRGGAVQPDVPDIGMKKAPETPAAAQADPVKEAKPAIAGVDELRANLGMKPASAPAAETSATPSNFTVLAKRGGTRRRIPSPDEFTLTGDKGFTSRVGGRAQYDTAAHRQGVDIDLSAPVQGSLFSEAPQETPIARAIREALAGKGNPGKGQGR